MMKKMSTTASRPIQARSVACQDRSAVQIGAVPADLENRLYALVAVPSRAPVT